MTVIIDGKTYHADTATDLIEKIKPIRWDSDKIPDADAYIKVMVKTYKKMTGKRMRLPRGDTETKAIAMFEILNDLGTWEYKKED